MTKHYNICPPPPYSKAHDFARRHANFQISKKKLLPPPLPNPGYAPAIDELARGPHPGVTILRFETLIFITVDLVSGFLGVFLRYLR